MISTLDSYLMEQTQRFCNRFTEVTGRTNYTLAKWFNIAATSFFLLAMAPRMNPVTVTLSFLLLVKALIVAASLDLVECAYLARGIPELPPFNKGHRIVLAVCMFIPALINVRVVLLSAGDAWDTFWSFGFVAEILSVYTVCTRPQPPGKNLFREWFAKGLKRLKGKFEPVPTPIVNS